MGGHKIGDNQVEAQVGGLQLPVAASRQEPWTALLVATINFLFDELV
jgi:hypothetical protein